MMLVMEIVSCLLIIGLHICRSQEGFNMETREVKEAVKLLDKNGDG